MVHMNTAECYWPGVTEAKLRDGGDLPDPAGLHSSRRRHLAIAGRAL